MINRRCRSCGLQLPMRSPAVECRQCRYKRGTMAIRLKLFGLLARGCEMMIDTIVGAEHTGIKASKKVQPVRGALAVKLANAQTGGR